MKKVFAFIREAEKHFEQATTNAEKKAVLDMLRNLANTTFNGWSSYLIILAIDELESKLDHTTQQ